MNLEFEEGRYYAHKFLCGYGNDVPLICVQGIQVRGSFILLVNYFIVKYSYRPLRLFQTHYDVMPNRQVMLMDYSQLQNSLIFFFID